MQGKDVLHMLSSIAYGLLAMFALTGVVAAIYLGMVLVMRPRGAGRFVVVIPAHASEADFAAHLCAARLRAGLVGGGEVIALDCGMGEQCRLQCEALCQGLERTKLLKPEELLHELTSD